MVTIHFIWTDEPVPTWVQRNISEFERLNPDKDICIHRDAGMLLTKYEDAYHSSTVHMQRADWLRASILERVGGWYFDCDCWPLKPLPELRVGSKLACLCWDTGCLNAMMYCNPGAPVWEHYHPRNPGDKFSGSHELNRIYYDAPHLFYKLGSPEWSAGRLDQINYDRAQFGMEPDAPEQQIVIHGS